MHKREEDTVAVVDTNSPQELPEVAGCRDHSVLCGYGQKLCVPLDQGILNASIHSIVDHHKLCGLINAEPLEAKALSFLQRGQDGTRKPAQVDMRPLCSATSILYARAKYIGLSPPKEVAGLMLAGRRLCDASINCLQCRFAHLCSSARNSVGLLGVSIADDHRARQDPRR